MVSVWMILIRVQAFELRVQPGALVAGIAEEADAQCDQRAHPLEHRLVQDTVQPASRAQLASTVAATRPVNFTRYFLATDMRASSIRRRELPAWHPE